jgi:hypothetical protein
MTPADLPLCLSPLSPWGRGAGGEGSSLYHVARRVSVSYDLSFWKQKPRVRLDPQAVYERLLEGERIEGLVDLPVDRILARIAETFVDGWERLDEYNWEAAEGSFQVHVSPQHFLISSYSLPGEVLNLFIDIGLEFGCRLYDPQTDVRFEA